MINTTLGKITTSIYDGKHGDCNNQLGSGLYFISVKDLEEYEINYDNAREITEHDFIQNYSRTSLEEGDSIYANTGDTIGKSMFIKNNPLVFKTSFQKSVAVLKPDKNIIHPRYLYYLLKQETPRLRKAATGSGQKNLLLSTMREFEVQIHDDDEQKKIVKVLGAIDDKIYNNNCINDTLQKQVSLLYDYWFTQFDFPDENDKPYISSGGKMVWNEELKREIPDGWDSIPIGELVSENTRGITPVYNDNKDIPVINQKCIRNGNIIFDEVYWHDSNFKHANNIQLLFMDTLVNSMGTGTLGRISPYILPYEAVPHSCVSLLRSKVGVSLPCWLYCSVKKLEPVITQKGLGSTGQTSLGNSELGELYVVVPPYYLMEHFEIIIKSMFEQMMKNNIQNRELTNLRDWLLPMLMNGQVTLSE